MAQLPYDLWYLIGKYVNDPKTWLSINLACKNISSRLKSLSESKKEQFKIIHIDLNNEFKCEHLPNGLLHGYCMKLHETFPDPHDDFSFERFLVVSKFDMGKCVGCFTYFPDITDSMFRLIYFGFIFSVRNWNEIKEEYGPKIIPLSDGDHIENTTYASDVDTVYTIKDVISF